MTSTRPPPQPDIPADVPTQCRRAEVDPTRGFVAEALGTCLLLAIVVGSGILGARIADGQNGLTLLANSIATAAGLYTLIVWFTPLSGAHLNPAVTLAALMRHGIERRTAVTYVAAQSIGAPIGVILANIMFGLDAITISNQTRSGSPLLLSEVVATFGLVSLVIVVTSTRPDVLAGSVAAYVGATFWFTPTGFANPAVTIGRTITDTFSGIRSIDAPAFIAAQLLGTVAAVALMNWFGNPRPERPLRERGRAIMPAPHTSSTSRRYGPKRA